MAHNKTGKKASLVDKPVVGFDLDGVLIDHTENKIRVIAEQGWKITPTQTPSDVLRVLLPNEVWRDVKITLYDDPIIALSPPLMDGAEACLERLTRAGIDYSLISRRKHPENALRLMEQRGLWPRYFSERNTFFVQQAEDKNEKARFHGVTHYIDDELSVLRQLFDVPYRFHYDRFSEEEDSNFVKVRSLAEFSDFVLGDASETAKSVS